MDKDLNDIKSLVNSLEKKRLNGVLIYSLGLLPILICTWLFFGLKPANNNQPITVAGSSFDLVCRISKDQKDELKAQIAQISDCGKTSKIALYKTLKAFLNMKQ